MDPAGRPYDREYPSIYEFIMPTRSGYDLCDLLSIVNPRELSSCLQGWSILSLKFLIDGSVKRSICHKVITFFHAFLNRIINIVNGFYKRNSMGSQVRCFFFIDLKKEQKMKRIK